MVKFDFGSVPGSPRAATHDVADNPISRTTSIRTRWSRCRPGVGLACARCGFDVPAMPGGLESDNPDQSYHLRREVPGDERVSGFEPLSRPWHGRILPLNYTRILRSRNGMDFWRSIQLSYPSVKRWKGRDSNPRQPDYKSMIHNQRTANEISKKHGQEQIGMPCGYLAVSCAANCAIRPCVGELRFELRT